MADEPVDEPISDDELDPLVLDALVAELERIGFVEAYTGEDGRIAYRLTPVGSRVAHRLELTGDAEGLDSPLVDDRA